MDKKSIMSSQKLGVIIQGPLLTFGQGPNNSMAGFDSTQTVLKNLERARLLSDSVVVTTWSPKNTHESELLDELSLKIGPVYTVDSPTLFDPDHRFKHHYGVLKGAEYLLKEDPSITHLVKIRTDMEMPESFWQWLIQVQSQNSDRLFVSELLPYPFSMGDFIYFGQSDIFLGFLKSVVEYGPRILHPSIATDIAMKYFIAIYYKQGMRELVGKKLKNPVYFALLSNSIQRDWDAHAKKDLGVLPKDIWLEMQWRGRRVGDFLPDKTFKFNTEPSKSSRTLFDNIKFIALDYYIYWNKAKITNPIVKLLGIFRFFIRALRRAPK